MVDDQAQVEAAPDLDAVGGFGFGTSDMDTHDADTRSIGKWHA
jgi:hypothetical protein